MGLGDQSYRFFSRCGKILDERFDKLGGIRFNQRSDIDLDEKEIINGWFSDILEKTEEMVIKHKDDWKKQGEDYLWAAVSADTSTSWGRNNPFFADCVEKYDLTKTQKAGDKETIHFEFNLGDSDISYTVGDSLGVLAPTPESEIRLLLKTLGIDPKLPVEK